MNRIVICGMGSIGKKHFKVIKENYPNTKIGLYRSGKGHPIGEEICPDYIFKTLNDSVRWRPEGVVISSPATFHFENSKPFINANIPLLIEKPLDSDFNDLKRWKEISKPFLQKKILVGYLLRHDPACQKIKNFLNKELIGKLINIKMLNKSWLPNWRPLQNYEETVSAKKQLGGGILLEQSHDINLAISLFGKIILQNAEVYKSGILNIEVEDSANIFFINKEEVPINIMMDFCSKKSKRELLIIGKKGTIFWDIENGFLSIETSNSIKNKSFKINPYSRMIFQYKHFIDVANGKCNPLVSIEDAINTLEIVKKIRGLNK